MKKALLVLDGTGILAGCLCTVKSIKLKEPVWAVIGGLGTAGWVLNFVSDMKRK